MSKKKEQLSLAARLEAARQAVAAQFQGPTWEPWNAVIARLTEKIRAAWWIVGRRGGKTSTAARLAADRALRIYDHAPGELVHVSVIAPDREQSGRTFARIRALIPEDLVREETSDSLTLENDVCVSVVTASIAAPRGRPFACVIIEEAAFLPTDDAADPDRELIRAVQPGLASVPSSLLCVISSPYARRGSIFEAAQRWAATGGDEETVFVQASTLAMNPSFPADRVRKFYEDDPVAAAAEFGGEFRGDVESLVTPEAVRRSTVPGRLELPPSSAATYFGFMDVAGGGPDSFAAAVAHAEGDVRVLDAVLEIRGPVVDFDAAISEFVALFRRYGVSRIQADRYAGTWPSQSVQRISKGGITCDQSERSKVDIYRDAVPLVNTDRLQLLDVPRLAAQFVGLERKTARGGRDSIDHGPGGHDDLCNAALGALLLAEESEALGGARTVYTDGSGDVYEPSPSAVEEYRWQMGGLHVVRRAWTRPDGTRDPGLVASYDAKYYPGPGGPHSTFGLDQDGCYWANGETVSKEDFERAVPPAVRGGRREED